MIKCKDCKYFQRWRYDPEVIKKYGQLYDCGLEVLTCPSPDDYCSKAEKAESDIKQGLDYADEDTLMSAT